MPGQFGLNAGVIPDPGITYANLALSYSASQLNNSNGNRIPGITGTYSFWVDENIIYYVPKHKFLGGYFMPYIALNWRAVSWWLTLPREQRTLVVPEVDRVLPTRMSSH